MREISVKCVQCNNQRTIKEDEAKDIPDGEMPMCEKCYGVMIPNSALCKNK